MTSDSASADALNASAQSQLRTIVERIERLEEDKAAIANDIKEVFAEAKGNGFDVKILRMVVRYRKQDAAKRQEEGALLDLYLSSLGELPLFEGRGKETAFESAALAAVPSFEDMADDLYEKAVAVVRTDGKASVSYVQRKLQLAYNPTVALFERMEREGVVGPPNHAGKREILGSGGGDIQMKIGIPGHEPIETTVRELKAATVELDRRKHRRG